MTAYDRTLVIGIGMTPFSKVAPRHDGGLGGAAVVTAYRRPAT